MFAWYDYIILFTALISSTLIGIYFSKKSKTVVEYVSGGKRLQILPAAISVVIGQITGIVYIGAPAEVYKYGAYYLYTCFSALILTLLSIFWYYPVLFKTQVSSIFEYLEKRFDRKTKLLGLIMYIIYENLHLPIVIFSAALALSHATRLNLHLVAFIICGVCIFYTAIGGLKTVIWTDLLQFIIVVGSFIILCYTGIQMVGGVENVFKTAYEGKRFDIFDFSLDPTLKDTVWISCIGLTARILSYFALSQSSVQKYLSLPTYKDCVRSLIITGVSFIFVVCGLVFFGLIVYTKYASCDPVLDGKIARNDEIVLHFVKQISKEIYGISGLFTTSVICAGISTLSSSLNALAATIYSDLLVEKLFRRELKEKAKLRILKLIVVVQGLVCAGAVFIIPYLGEIIPLIVGSTGVIDGPALGIITVGILFPNVKADSVFYGSIGGIVLISCIYFPANFLRYNQKMFFKTKPLSTKSCLTSNSTNLKNVTFHNFYKISYQYYCLIGVVITVILSLILHKISKRRQQQPQEKRELEKFIPQKE